MDIVCVARSSEWFEVAGSESLAEQFTSTSVLSLILAAIGRQFQDLSIVVTSKTFQRLVVQQ